MAWDFSTEPEFQEKLDWVKQFCEEKIEPLDHIFPHAVRSPIPAVKAYVRELQQEVKDQGLWAIFLDRELGGPGTTDVFQLARVSNHSRSDYHGLQLQYRRRLTQGFQALAGVCAMPGSASGSVMVRNTRQRVAPMLKAAFSMFGSILARMGRSVR